MPTLLDHMVRNAAEAPDKPFIILWESGKYRVITNRDFLLQVRSLSYFIKSKMRCEGEVVFIVMQHHPLLHAMFIACMLAGAIPSYLPFPTPKQDPDRYFASHKALFDRVQPACIITYGALADAIGAIAPEATEIALVEDYVHTGYFDIDGFKAAPDAVALLQHSSGTTGLKKGVALTFAQIEAQARQYALTAGIDSRSVIVSWLPLYHDMGLLTSFLIPLSTASSVVAINAFEWVKDPGLLLRAIQIFNGTHSWLPNFAFNHIVKAVPDDQLFDLTSMKAFISCSEPSKPATIKTFSDRFGPSGATLDRLQACYAMAETVFAVSQYPIGTPNRILHVDSQTFSAGKIVSHSGNGEGSMEFVSNGPPMPGIELAILQPDGVINVNRDVDIIGEILVRGNFVFDGYHRNPSATELAFFDGWYKTGDLGFLEGGELFICGRTKDLIIVHGRNFYCHDIEEIASSVEGVIPGRAVAIGVSNESTASEELLLLVETHLDGVETAQHKALRRELKRAVFEALELTPHDVEFVAPGWLVKTTSGKLSRVENLTRLFREKATSN